MFYVTSDDEFIIKTVMHKEAEFLQKLLPGYYMVSGPSLAALWHVGPSSPRGTPTLLRGSGSLAGPLSLALRTPSRGPCPQTRQAGMAIQARGAFPKSRVGCRGLGAGHLLRPRSPGPPQPPASPESRIPEILSRGARGAGDSGVGEGGRATSWHVTKAQLLGRVPFPM